MKKWFLALPVAGKVALVLVVILILSAAIYEIVKMVKERKLKGDHHEKKK